MSKSKKKIDEIIAAINNGEKVDNIINRLSSSDKEWNRISHSVYKESLEIEKKKRRRDEKKPHVGVTSVEQIDKILEINETLSSHALMFPTIATISDYDLFYRLAINLDKNQDEILKEISRITMQPSFRVRQKKGRFEKLPPFSSCIKIIDAATVSYYRKNYISCYFTLVPLIEGIILRWSGFKLGTSKPNFEELRKFFKMGYRRQPYPYNVLFHNVFSIACDKILNNHLYLPTQKGTSHDEFNRHIATHLLSDSQFATQDNCIRLFMLLDTMTEIYLYEERMQDPRFNIRDDETRRETLLIANLIADGSTKSAESTLL